MGFYIMGFTWMLCPQLRHYTVSAVGGARPLLVRTLDALESSPYLTNRKAALLDSDAYYFP